MKRESPTTIVANRIRELESQYGNHVRGLKSSFSKLGDQLKPSNLLESGVKDIVRSKSVRSTAILSTLGIGAGFFAKKLVINKSKSLLKRVAGTGLQLLITALFASRIQGRKVNDKPIKSDGKYIQ